MPIKINSDIISADLQAMCQIFIKAIRSAGNDGKGEVIDGGRCACKIRCGFINEAFKNTGGTLGGACLCADSLYHVPHAVPWRSRKKTEALAIGYNQREEYGFCVHHASFFVYPVIFCQYDVAVSADTGKNGAPTVL